MHLRNVDSMLRVTARHWAGPSPGDADATEKRPLRAVKALPPWLQSADDAIVACRPLRPRSDLVLRIETLFERHGRDDARRTRAQPLTPLEHALQCARLAEWMQADDALVAAALLHDIGHLLHDLPENVADSGIDTQHESTGSAWLSQYFGPEVSEPVRMHVAAKRFLASTQAGYFDELSDASKLSLRLQGGPLTPVQALAFQNEPFFEEAVRLRRWDEEGKIVGYRGPALAHFDPAIRACLKVSS